MGEKMEKTKEAITIIKIHDSQHGCRSCCEEGTTVYGIVDSEGCYDYVYEGKLRAFDIDSVVKTEYCYEPDGTDDLRYPYRVFDPTYTVNEIPGIIQMIKKTDDISGVVAVDIIIRVEDEKFCTKYQLSYEVRIDEKLTVKLLSQDKSQGCGWCD